MSNQNQATHRAHLDRMAESYSKLLPDDRNVKPLSPELLSMSQQAASMMVQTYPQWKLGHLYREMARVSHDFQIQRKRSWSASHLARKQNPLARNSQISVIDGHDLKTWVRCCMAVSRIAEACRLETKLRTGLAKRMTVPSLAARSMPSSEMTGYAVVVTEFALPGETEDLHYAVREYSRSEYEAAKEFQERFNRENARERACARLCNVYNCTEVLI